MRRWASQCPQQDLSSNDLSWSEIAQDKCVGIEYAIHSLAMRYQEPWQYSLGTTILKLPWEVLHTSSLKASKPHPQLWFLGQACTVFIYITTTDTRHYMFQMGEGQMQLPGPGSGPLEKGIKTKASSKITPWNNSTQQLSKSYNFSHLLFLLRITGSGGLHLPLEFQEELDNYSPVFKVCYINPLFLTVTKWDGWNKYIQLGILLSFLQSVWFPMTLGSSH